MDWKRLAEIEARANAASPGPWRADPYTFDGREHSVVIGPNYSGYEHDMGLNDAEFIAHARTDIPELIAEIRRLQHESRQEGRPARSCKGCGGERVLLAYCDTCKTP